MQKNFFDVSYLGQTNVPCVTGWTKPTTYKEARKKRTMTREKSETRCA